MTFSWNRLICVDSPVLELCGRKTLSHSCPLLVLGGAISGPDRQLGVPEVNDLSDPQMTSPMQTSVETTVNSRETPDTVDVSTGDETTISTERTIKGDPSRESIIGAAGGISFTESVGSEVLNSSDSGKESTISATSADYSTTPSAMEVELADYNATAIVGEIESADHNNTVSNGDGETLDSNTTVAVVETELSDSRTTPEILDSNSDQNTTAPGEAINIDYYTTPSTESEVADNSTDAYAAVDHSTASRGGPDTATNSTSAEEPENSDHSNTDYADVNDDADDSTTKAAEQTKNAHNNTTPSEDAGLFGAFVHFKNKNKQGAKCVGPKQTCLLHRRGCGVGQWA